MQRIIKFRAWDIEKGAFYPLDKMEGIGGFYYDYGVTPRPKHFTLEQFTNLLDKNGKEIYEGDILRRENSPMVSRNTGETIKNGHGPAFRVDWLNNIQKNGFNVAKGDRYVIVGNIHENPELLKQAA